MPLTRRLMLASLSAAPFALTHVRAAVSMLRPLHAPAQPFSEVLHGIRVEDPYRWLEEDSPASRGFISEEAAYARAFLDRLPGRARFLDRITALTAGDMPGDEVQVAGGRIFTFRRNAGSESMNLLVRDTPTATDRVLVNARKLGTGGANAGIDYLWSVSPDGRFVAFGYFENGSEELTIRVVEVARGALLADALTHVDMTARSWAPDSSGFFYNRLAPGQGAEKYNNNGAWFHRLGTQASEDVLALKGDMTGVGAPSSDAPLVFAVPGSDYALGQFVRVGELIDSLYIAPLADATAGRARWQRFANPEDGVLSATLWRDQVYAVITRAAPRGKLVKTPAANPKLATAQTVLPERADFMISVSPARDALYVETRHIALNGVMAVHPDGSARDIQLPFDGADVIGLHSAGNQDGAWLLLQSWVRQPVLCQIHSNGSVGTFPMFAGSSSAASDYMFTVENVTARDGVKVPLTLIRRKDARRDGSIPIIMTAYGAYGTILPTRYTPADMAWLEKGGALAIAHVRGGGEFGEPWHLAALKASKPNTWRDLIDCARWLIAARWTSANRLAIQGKSAGGIAVGRAVTEAPETFGCAIVRVPAVNTLRMHKTPVGPANFPEFGDPANASEFRSLLEMDAYQHVKAGAPYPPMLFTAGMEDGRIPPWQPGKMVARLQAVSCNPALLRIELKGGHGLGLTRDQENAEKADIFAFTWWALHRRGQCSAAPPQ